MAKRNKKTEKIEETPATDAPSATEGLEVVESGETADVGGEVPERAYEDSVVVIPLDSIVIEPGFNSRKKFDENEIKALAGAIKAQGLINPLTVRRITVDGEERFGLVAGERRYRALQRLGATKVVATVHGWDQRDALIANLGENVDREDLTAGELATRITELHDEHGMTYAQIAKRIGKSAPHVENLARIVKNSHPTILKLFLDGDSRWAAPTPTLKFCLSTLTLDPEQQMEAFEAEYGENARKLAESGAEVGDGEEKEKKPKKSSAGEPKMRQRPKVAALLADLRADRGASLKGVSGDDAEITERDRKVLRRFLKWILGVEESYPLNVPVDDEEE